MAIHPNAVRILREGWLKKRGPNPRSGFKKRYCLLYSDGRFKYYEDELQEKECGDVSFVEIDDIQRDNTSLVIETPTRTWYFETDEALTALQWRNDFRKLKRSVKSQGPGVCVHGGIAKEGWLKKQGGSFRTWRTRWCVLYNDGVFKYFTDEEKMEQKNVADICFRDLLDVAVEADVLTVETGNRQWVFQAEGETDDDANLLAGEWFVEFRKFHNLSNVEIIPEIPGIVNAQARNQQMLRENMETTGRCVERSAEMDKRAEEYAGLAEEFREQHQKEKTSGGWFGRMLSSGKTKAKILTSGSL